MKCLVLAEGVSGSAVAAQTAVTLTATPFVSGRDVVGVIAPADLTGTPNHRIQGSDDNIAWVDLMTNTTLALKMQTIILRPYMRFNVVTGGTAGLASAYLLNGT